MIKQNELYPLVIKNCVYWIIKRNNFYTSLDLTVNQSGVNSPFKLV